MIEAPRRPLTLIGHNDGANATLTVLTFGADDQLHGVDAFDIRGEAGGRRRDILQHAGAVVGFVGKTPAIAQRLCRRGPGGTAIQRHQLADTNRYDRTCSRTKLNVVRISRRRTGIAAGITATTIGRATTVVCTAATATGIAAITRSIRIDVGTHCGLIGTASTATARNLQYQKTDEQIRQQRAHRTVDRIGALHSQHLLTLKNCQSSLIFRLTRQAQI